MTLPHSKPTLHVFAGPNGAGKSTLFDHMQQLHLLDGINQVNGDVIYKANPRLTQDELAAIVGDMVKDHFQQNNSFSIESNLATSASYNIIQSARAKGYLVYLYYVNLDSVQKCRSRVIERVSRGGHDVPFPIIEHRYTNALSLIKQHYALFDQLDFIDNSAGDFRSVIQIETGKIIYEHPTLPDWAASIAKHIRLMEKVQRKKQE